MKKYFRIAIFVALVFSIVFLAKNKVVWAGSLKNVVSQSGLAQLTGFVWNDVDRDGVQDPGESGIPNVTVDLYNSTKTLANTAVTDANGRYKFDGLTPGDYFVDFVPLAGYVFSPKEKGAEGVDSDADVISGETVLANLVAGENSLQWDAGLYKTTTLFVNSAPGSVKPPPAELTACEQGDFSVGGVSILKVHQLVPGYCLTANLWNHAFALGRVPDGSGKVLADITFLRVFYQGRLVYEVPSQDGNIEICYAVPPDIDNAKIYFYDFYGPRFGKRTGQPSWEPLQTTVTGGAACAAAQTSGAYALIGQ